MIASKLMKYNTLIKITGRLSHLSRTWTQEIKAKHGCACVSAVQSIILFFSPMVTLDKFFAHKRNDDKTTAKSNRAEGKHKGK